MHSSDTTLRRQVLVDLGADVRQADDLLIYNRNHFQETGLTLPRTLPLEDEKSVLEWCGYAHEAMETGVEQALKAHLPQLSFPVRLGISQELEYRQATRSGVPTAGMESATGLELSRSSGLELVIHPTIAGRIPILVAREREDFEDLLRAFLYRNEPREIPASMGAAMIAGFNNWSRVAKLRAAFEAAHPGSTEADWLEEFGRIKPQHHLYQDRFILVSDTPYSGVSEEKRALGRIIRFEHESTHYMTKRLLGSMKNNLLDELIADYAGITAAAGAFRADWFLRFMGLEDFPRYREGGRFQNYLADPPLPPDCMTIEQALLVQAAHSLAAFDAKHLERLRSPRGRALMPLALCRLTLELLASDHSAEILEREIDCISRDFQIADDWRER